MMAENRRTFGDRELSFLAAIHEDPRSDAPRLVYADWLEGEGRQEYAEFIRLQCRKPYIGVVYQLPSEPRQSYLIGWSNEDPDAFTRLDRLLTLAPHAYRVDKPGLFVEELYRGLPLLQEETWYDLGLLDRIGPAARLHLILRTSTLEDWLDDPIMQRVEMLSIQPEFPPDAKCDIDSTMNSHYDRFWSENIPLLVDSPLIDRLQELQPCGCRSTGELTEQSRENIALCREFIEPRVLVDYGW